MMLLVTGYNVVFTDTQGDTHIAIVDVIWARSLGDDRPPLINVTIPKTLEKHTSVPHRNDVPGASGFYYT